MNEKEKLLILFTSLKGPVYKLKASKYNCSEPPPFESQRYRARLAV